MVSLSGAVEVAPAARPGRRDRRPRLDRLDAPDERAARHRRHPRLRGDPRRQPGGLRGARAGARRHRDDARLGDRRPRPQVPDDERPGDEADRARGPPPGPRVAVGHPARPRGDDRDPLGRRLGRGLGPPAAAQGRRRVGDPRPARSRRSCRDRARRSRDASRSAASTCARPMPRRERERDALCRRGAVPDPAVRDAARTILADVRERGADAVRDAAARFGGGRPDGRLLIERAELRAAADAPVAHRSRRARDRHRERPPVRGGAAAGHHPDHDRRRRRARAPLAPRPSRRRLCTRRLGALPELARHGRRPARWSRASTRSSSRRPRTATGTSTRSCSARPACSRSTRCSSRAASRRSRRSRTASRPRVWRRWTSSSGPGPPGSPPPRSRSPARWASTCPPARPRGWSSRMPTADARTVAADLVTQAEHGPDSPALLVTPDEALADAVEAEVRRRLATREPPRHPRPGPRATTAGSSSSRTSTPASPSSTTTARSTCPWTSRTLEPTVDRIRNAGSIFVGRWSPESAGDYASGANHVLPTGGLARACGPLAVETFGKFNQVQRITREGLADAPAGHPRPRRGRGPARPPRRRRGPLRR